MSYFFAEEIVGKRARFQRVSDSKLLYGWVTHFGSDQITVSVGLNASIQVGDRFAFQVHTPSAAVRFIGDHAGIVPAADDASVAQSGSEANHLFKILGRIQHTPPQEEGRHRLDQRPVDIAVGDRTVSGQLYDVSPTGAGVIASESFEAGVRVKLTVQDQGRAITVEAEVRYATSAEGATGSFRIGMKLVESNRLACAQWRGLLDVA